MFGGISRAPSSLVGLDLRLKKTGGTVMSTEGKILKQEKFSTSKEDLGGSPKGLPGGTKVALESVGFCWPWIDFIGELGHVPLLVNPSS